MANDCLVTKLKGSVDNANLSVLGMFRVKFTPNGTAGASDELTLIVSEDTTIKIEGGTFNDGNTSKLIPANTVTKILTNNVESTIFIPKYNVTAISNLNGKTKPNFSDLDYLGNGNLVGFNVEDGIGSITSFENVSINNFKIRSISSTLSGDLTGINIAGNLEVHSPNLQGTVVLKNTNGDINTMQSNVVSDFSQLSTPSITKIRGRGKGNVLNLISSSIQQIELYGTDVVGTTESVVEKLYDLGVTSGTITFKVYSTSVTLNGVKVPGTAMSIHCGNTMQVYNGEYVVATYDGSTWTYNL